MKKLTSLVFVLLLTILSGCTNESGKVSGGDVAAVVNGVEITKRQVEFLYQRSARPGMSAQDSANLRRRILGELVSIELLAGKAKEMKLDNDPDYTMDLYNIQKNVLASYAEKKIADSQSTVSDEQAESVVLNNPQLFSGRKLFVYDEVLFPGAEMPLLNSLDAMATSGAPLSRILDELNAKKIPFNKTLKSLVSEQIPVPVLNVLNGLKPNFPQVIHAGKNLSLILVLHDAIPSPLEGTAATNAAKMMITTNQKNQALSKSIANLLNGAKITYYDEYEKSTKGNQMLLALPTPDAKKANNLLYKKVFFASILSASYTLAIMMVTAVMRTLYNKMWLPQHWFGLSSHEHMKPYDVRVTSTMPRRIYLLGIVLLVVGTMLFELALLWTKLNVLALLACIGGGIIVGFIASQLFQTKFVQNWSRKTYMIAATVFALPILAGVMMTMRVSFYW